MDFNGFNYQFSRLKHIVGAGFFPLLPHTVMDESRQNHFQTANGKMKAMLRFFAPPQILNFDSPPLGGENDTRMPLEVNYNRSQMTLKFLGCINADFEHKTV